MEQQLLVLLLPQRLERFDLEPQARELLRAPGAVAVDPARIPVGRIPATVAAGLAVGQAKRMRLPGMPGRRRDLPPAPVLSRGRDALPPPDRRALVRRARAPERGRRFEQLHTAASTRAALTFPVTTDLDVTPLQLRMAELGILTG